MANPWSTPRGAGTVTTVDLEANRAGRLSSGQVDGVSSLRRQQLVVMVVTAIAALFVAGIWLVALATFLGTRDPVALLFLAGTSLLLGGAGLIEVGTLIFVRRVAADLVAGRVVTADGAVAWGRGGYRAYAGPRRLSRLSPANTLPPGGYRLSFLPNSGLLLSADAVAGDAPGATTQAEPELLGILSRAVGFSSSDLAANRQGRLAAPQRLRLLGRELVELLLAIGCCAAAVIAIELGIGPPATAVPFVVAAVAFLLALFLVVRVYRGGEDAFEGGCLSVLGAVTTRQMRDRRSSSYWAEVDGKSYQVSEAAFQAIVPFAIYRVYVTARSGVLVSMEPVGSATGPAV